MSDSRLDSMRRLPLILGLALAFCLGWMLRESSGRDGTDHQLLARKAAAGVWVGGNDVFVSDAEGGLHVYRLGKYRRTGEGQGFDIEKIYGR